MVPATLVIGDDLSFRLENVTSGRTGLPIPTAVVAWELLDAETRVEVDSGDMTQYDAVNASYEGIVPRASLEEFDADSNPTGIRPKRKYVLRTPITHDSKTQTKAVTLVAVRDPLENA